MAADSIILRRDQTAATEVGELLAWIRDLRSVYERGVRIRAKMQHNFEANPDPELIDWAALETLWGVPVNEDNGATPSVGTLSNGKAIYTYLDGTVGGMEGQFQSNAGKEVTERVM